jgi:putative ABC transport system permease protein
MMLLLELAWRSLLNRRVSVILTMLSIMLSVVVVIGVEHLRSQARENFTRTVSGVDLVVGARTSQLNLLLYAVFRIGNASNSVSWDSFEKISADPRVAWSIPLVLGDSHRGYRVLGTSPDYFLHYRFGGGTALKFTSGKEFGNGVEAVLGAEVARKLGYEVGSELTIAHGLVSTSFSLHQGPAFVVTGVLAATGTPVDQTIHISLEALETLHASPAAASATTHDEAGHAHAEPQAITAFLVGLHSRAAVFSLQRDINNYGGEPLTAILPGVALAELWQSVGGLEQVLALISSLVTLAALLGLATMLLASMRERSREIALYRALGAHASTILLLVELEALLLVCLGIAAGFVLVHLALRGGQGWLNANYGLMIDTIPFNGSIATFLLMIVAAALVLALIPALAAYRSSLATRLRGS